MGHSALITTTIEIADQTTLQIPLRTDGHRSLVVSTEETANLESVAAGVRETGVNTHLVTETVCCQQLACRIIRCLETVIGYTTYNLTRIIHTDNSTTSHRRIVTTAIGIDDGAAKNLQISLTKVR